VYRVWRRVTIKEIGPIFDLAKLQPIKLLAAHVFVN
jgi:hypothetical protein